MLENGYISLHRKMQNWIHYKNIPVKVLFIHLLFNVNYEKKYWKGITIERGEMITSLKNLSEETGLTIQEVRTALNKLVLTKEITNISTKAYRLIKVVNYSDYQEAKKKTNKDTNNVSNNNGINLNNINNIYLSENLTKLTNFVKSIYQDFDDRQIDIIGNLLLNYSYEDITDVINKTAIRSDVDNPLAYILTSIKKYKKNKEKTEEKENEK